MYGDKLYFYEEILLLALKDETGVASVEFLELSIAGAIMADLLMAQRIVVEKTKKAHVTVIDEQALNDPVIDVCFDMIKAHKKGLSMDVWVSRLSEIRELFHKAANRLCERGILKADKDKILLFFSRRIYPEINPIPEKKLIRQLQTAIFSESRDVDPRIVVLIALAQGLDLLKVTFGLKEIKARKDRIENIINGEVTGKAVKEVIESCHNAAMMAIILPAVIMPILLN